MCRTGGCGSWHINAQCMVVAADTTVVGGGGGGDGAFLRTPWCSPLQAAVCVLMGNMVLT